MRVPLRKAVCWLKRDDANPTGVYESYLVLEGRLISHLDKSITRDTTLLSNLPQYGLFDIVNFPDPLEKCRDYVCVLGDGLELDSPGKAEVGDEVGQSTGVVCLKLRFSRLSPVSPVV